MSTVAQPALAVKPAPAHHWTPWLILAADVLALEIAFGLFLLAASARFLVSLLTRGAN
jgi:hypothetical protein